jgi:hypothetical protein
VKIYNNRPKTRRARKVWDYITKLRGKEPKALWKNPNCWGYLSATGNAWGFWIAQFDFGKEYEPILPEDVK